MFCPRLVRIACLCTCASLSLSLAQKALAQEAAVGIPTVEIEFSHQGGLVGEGQDITLDIGTKTDDVAIYYTLDGSQPTPENNWHEFDKSLTIRRTTIVRAVGIRGQRVVGRGSRSFLFANSNLTSFRSDLPIVVISAFGTDIDSEARWDSRAPKRPVSAVFIGKDQANGRVSIMDTADFIGRAGMRVRGQTSAQFPKKQYSLELWDEEANDRSASLLGLPAESDWILHAPWTDKTLMRNVLAYRWFREMGHYGPRTKFIELFHDADGGSIGLDDYRGVYVLMEKIKRNENRVALAKLDESMTTEPEITGGYIFKIDKGTHNDVNFDSAVHNFGFVEPDQPNDAQFSYLRNQIVALEKALRSRRFMDPELGYAAYMDIPSFIDVHIHVELCKNVDGFRYSTYLHKDRQGKIHLGPVWDYNLSLGNSFSHEGDNPRGWYHHTIDDHEYLYFERLFEDPNFEVRYWDRYYELRNTVFATEKLLRQIDDLEEQLRESQARNFARWPIFDQHLFRNPNIVVSLKTHGEQVRWMKQWLRRRLTWMDQQFTPPPVITPANNEVTFGTQVTIEPVLRQDAIAPTILYTTDGSDPRKANGKPSPQAERLKSGGSLSLTAATTIKARVYGRNRWGALAEQVYKMAPP